MVKGRQDWTSVSVCTQWYYPGALSRYDNTVLKIPVQTLFFFFTLTSAGTVEFGTVWGDLGVWWKQRSTCATNSRRTFAAVHWTNPMFWPAWCRHFHNCWAFNILHAVHREDVASKSHVLIMWQWFYQQRNSLQSGPDWELKAVSNFVGLASTSGLGPVWSGRDNTEYTPLQNPSLTAIFLFYCVKILKHL